jgi:hypothetical protein
MMIMPSSPDNKILTDAAQEHARIVRSVMDNLFAVAAEVDILEVVAGRKPPISPVDILQAAARVQRIDAKDRKRLEAAARMLLELRGTFTGLPKGHQDILQAAASQLRGSRDIDELAYNIDLLAAGTPEYGLRDGAMIGRAILQSGLKSIYNPTLPYYRAISKGSFTVARDVIVHTANADLAGGIVGGALGAKSGDWRATVVAAGGVAVAASTTQLIKDAFDDITGENDVDLFDNIKHWFPVPR